MDGGDHAAEARVAQSRHPAARLAAPRFRPGAHDKGSHDIGEMSQDAGESRPSAACFALHGFQDRQDCLATFNSSLWVDLALITLWGMAFGAVPVAWSTWLTRTIPDEAESAGGLLVAAVQVAIMIGAAGGGAIYDFKGAIGVFGASSLVLFAAALMVPFVVPTRADEAS